MRKEQFRVYARTVQGEPLNCLKLSCRNVQKSSWRPPTNSIKSAVLFENGEREFIFIAAKCSGNPVRIRNGCATVTGYKLPTATAPLIIHECGGKAGARFKPEVRIPVWMRSSWSFIVNGQLLRKEKDEASLFRVCEAGLP